MHDSDKLRTTDKTKSECGTSYGEDFVKTYVKTLNELSQFENKVFDVFLEDKQIDKNLDTDYFYGENHETINLRRLPKSERRKRQELKNSLFINAAETASKIGKNMEFANSLDIGPEDRRSTYAIFTNSAPTGDDSKIETLVQTLMDKNVPSDIKVKEMANYIDKVADQAAKLFSYKSDEEFVKNFYQLTALKDFFGVDNIAREFERLSGEKMPDDLNNHYKILKNHFQTPIHAYSTDFARITDPTYTIYDKDDALKIGDYMQNVDYYDKYMGVDDEFSNKNHYFGGIPCEPGANYSSYISQLNVFVNEDKVVDYIKTTHNVEKGHKFFDENGNVLDDKQADELAMKGKPIGFQDSDSKMFFFRKESNSQLTAVEIDPNQRDHSDKYKTMLKKLNSGTSIFTRSSEEYRNMRSILGKLASNQNPEVEKELLQSLNENIAGYRQKYANKKTISETAWKRRNLVEEVAREADILTNENNFYDVIKNAKVADNSSTLEESTNAKDINGGKKQVILEELQEQHEISNSVKDDENSKEQVIQNEGVHVEEKPEEVKEEKTGIDKLLEDLNEGEEIQQPLTQEELDDKNKALDKMLNDFTK